MKAGLRDGMKNNQDMVLYYQLCYKANNCLNDITVVL